MGALPTARLSLGGAVRGVLRTRVLRASLFILHNRDTALTQVAQGCWQHDP